MNKSNELTAIGEVTNDAAKAIAAGTPYMVEVTIVGSSPILFHRWSNEAVAEKAAAAKGSKAKKTDDVESYVYRNEERQICLPGTYLVGSLTDPSNGAAKYRQDPRSPRKSALALFRAGVVPLTALAPITAANQKTPAQKWDFEDARRVKVQQSAITRVRPAFHEGWSATVSLLVLTPEYISPNVLQETLTMAGRLVGVGDYRPTYGRFQVTKFDIGFKD